ncbi:hypothetical protein EAH89_17160 [Roseomonas nepalensis]|uniref:Uncharacterized protein n=2 Tax=Muricoccus nepalensis TaxID=1854500 RepID=A0A502FUM1_9PROT|nr:hypothetical protein EAH89_17160 [Roseomonas nepalensis]
MVVGISGPLLAELSWPQVGKLRVQHDPETGKLRLSAGGEVKTRSTGAKATGASLAFSWALSSDAKRAEVAPHVIEDGALIVTLPAWAAPQRSGMAGAQAARDAALAKLGTPPSTPRAPYLPISDRVKDPAALGGRRG